MSRVDFVGLGRQTAGMGTKVTTMNYYPPVEECDPAVAREEMTIEETIGNRAPTALDYGTRFFNIDVKLAPRAAALPRILSAFTGQPTTSGAGPYTHTQDCMAAGKVPEPHSIFVVRKDPSPAIVDLFWDARGDEFTLSMAPNDYVKLDAKFIALDLDDTQSAPTPSIDATNRWKFSQVIAYVNLNGGGEAAVQCRDAEVMFGNSLDTDEAVLGSRKLYALPYGNLTGQVKFSPRESLSSYYREALKADPTTTSVRLVATGTGGEVIETRVKACEFVDAPAKVDGGDVLKMVEVTARAKYDTASSQFITFVTTNSVATY